MMTDPKVLADALVEAGIIRQDADMSYLYWPTTHGASFMTIPQTITDWRVAGKVLESMEWIDWSDLINGGPGLGSPRAIIEAWYESR